MFPERVPDLDCTDANGRRLEAVVFPDRRVEYFYERSES